MAKAGKRMRWNGYAALAMAAAMLLAPVAARADAVSDWNAIGCKLLTDARLPAAPAHRALAIVHSAMYRAARASAADPGVDIGAALAASGRTALLALVPSQQDAVEAAYAAALAGGSASASSAAARAAGIAVGESAAVAVLAGRADDGASAEAAYEPGGNGAGEYVPTAQGATPGWVGWGRRKPWLMAAADAFRPPPPPALTGVAWLRDLQEVHELGGRDSQRRSAADRDAAQFWAANAPAMFYGLAQGVAQLPGRSLLRNARLYAALAQAADDTLIATFEAKYRYRFWRPVTAVRLFDPGWIPLLETPMHPEYPCAHCAIASVFAIILQADLGQGSVPLLETVSPSANGAQRRWTTLAAFSREVAQARIHGGIHFRSSTEAGAALGQRVGTLAASVFQLGGD